jgi:hypothetical protein
LSRGVLNSLRGRNVSLRERHRSGVEGLEVGTCGLPSDCLHEAGLQILQAVAV